MSVVVKLAIESYTEELYSVRKGGGISCDTDFLLCYGLCSLCQITSESFSLASVTRSSTKAWRNPGISLADHIQLEY